MAALTIAPLPLEQIQADREANPVADAMWLSFGDNGTPFCLVGIYNEAQAKLEEMETIRTAHATAKERLLTSQSPEAIAFREAKERAEAVKENLPQELKDAKAAAQRALDEVNAQIAERTKAITAKVSELSAKAIEAETGTVLSDVDAEEKGREYKLIVDKFRGMKDVLVPQGIESLKGFTLPGLGAAKGTNKGNKAGNADGQWRPRFASASVNDVPVPPNAKGVVTGTEIAKVVGIQLSNFQQALATELGAWKAPVPTDHEVTFIVKDQKVTVLGREHKTAETEETE